MDKSRGFRHELVLRVGRAKFGTEPFIPFCNATNDLRICVQCGQMAPKMKRCTGCKWARYCDRECQKENWLTHRSECCPDRCLPAGVRTIPYPILAQAASRLTGYRPTVTSMRSPPGGYRPTATSNSPDFVYLTISFRKLVLTRNTVRCWRHHAENQRGLRCSRTLVVDYIVMRSSFRLWRHRTEEDWTELRSKSRFVDRWRKQYLTRHAFDLWYLDMLKTVSRRAVRVLLLVRRWQRIDWDLWVFRFRYLTLTGRVLRAWRDDPPGLIATSSDEAFAQRIAAPVHCSSSDDDSTHMFVAMHVISSSQVAPVRLRRHRLDRRSRRDWV